MNDKKCDALINRLKGKIGHAQTTSHCKTDSAHSALCTIRLARVSAAENRLRDYIIEAFCGECNYYLMLIYIIKTIKHLQSVWRRRRTCRSAEWRTETCFA